VSHPKGITELGDGLFVHIPDDQWANTGVVVGDDGVLVVDARLTPRMAREIVDAVRYLTPKPIKYLVDTHHHGDHTFGNCVYARFATIISHAATRSAIEAASQAAVNWGARFPEMAADFGEIVITPPVLTYTDRLTIHLGRTRVELRHFGHGHTAGDTVIMVPRERFAFVGDLLSNGVHPVMGDADTHGWQHSLEAIRATGTVDRVVGGHGPVGDQASLVKQSQYIDSLRATLAALHKAGVPAVRAAEELTSVPGFEEYGYAYRMKGGIGRFYREMEAAGGQ
jgi:cyclase